MIQSWIVSITPVLNDTWFAALETFQTIIHFENVLKDSLMEQNF